MTNTGLNPDENRKRTKQLIEYVPRRDATPETYATLGFKCGLEIHQQLKTEKKLFCRCPAGIYHDFDDYDAEVIRHMRPTLSELGEYDGTALMEFKTKKNIVYRIKNETACTYEFDDTPPFPIDREALDYAIEIALLLRANVVGELHITRKQYLDGSIPTGFQRTAIISIEGEISLQNKTVRIIQLSIEEDSCREVSDIGHWRIYSTDRLGIPLIEMVTYPDMLTPDEAAEAGHYLRFLVRSSGKVRTGIGAARQDVNVSINGGTRVEIKGVAHISWIPELTHNEAFRQKALLEISKILNKKIQDVNTWAIIHKEIDPNRYSDAISVLPENMAKDMRLTAVNLPGFAGILSFFTQPGKVFADEISDRLKVVACLEKPNMAYSEQSGEALSDAVLSEIRALVGARKDDAQIVVWGPSEDVDTALDTISERCQMAFEGVPNETRKSLSNGTTIFERVLPGANRMYPDTDSAPIPIENAIIEKKKQNLPPSIHDRLIQLKEWQIPEDTYHYLLKRNLVPLIEKIVAECKMEPRFIGTLLGHTLKNIEGRFQPASGFSYNKLYGLAKFIESSNLEKDIMKAMMPVIYEHPNIVFDSVLTMIGFKPISTEQIFADIPTLKDKFNQIKTSKNPIAGLDWIMGRLRDPALGNIPLRELRARVEKEIQQ